MASESEIKKEVKIALSEVGSITPWYDKEFDAWIFSHRLYPVECEGNSAEEVIQKYPKYLEVFVRHRMNGMLDDINEKKTKGKGGVRVGAGRPLGTKKESTMQVRLPVDIAKWIKAPGMIDHIRQMASTYKHVC